MTEPSLSKVPKTSQRGLIATSTGNGDEVAWVPGSALKNGFLMPVPINWPGVITDFSGGIPSSAALKAFIPVAGGTQVQLVGCALSLSSAGLVIDIECNGVGVAGLTGLFITYFNSPQFFTCDPATLANNDEVGLNITSNYYGHANYDLAATLYLSVGLLSS